MTGFWEGMGIVSAGVAAVGFLSKILVRQLLAKDLEQFKSGLENEKATFKADLERTAFEPQITFSRLHERQAAAICELCGLLVDMEIALKEMIDPFLPYQEKEKNMEFIADKERHVAESVNLYSDYFKKNEILLGADTCAAVQAVLDQALSGVKSHFVGKSLGRIEFEESMRLWNETRDAIRSKLPEAKEAVKLEFRALLQGRKFVKGSKQVTDQ